MTADNEGTVARLARRERELSALIASATDLMSELNEQTVLTRLVRRAHELIAVDLTYLSEYLPDVDELLVRATDGSISGRLLGLRVPPRRGLASRVVSARVPQSIVDYWADASVDHDSEIDRAVRAEGMVSLLGVPLTTGDEVLGVLFVADRTRRVFMADEVALLSAFAGHAAVALQSARLVADATQAAREANEARAAVQAQLSATEAAAAVHEELTAHLLAEREASSVAATLSRSLGRDVGVYDRHLAAATPGPIPVAAADVETLVGESAASGRAAQGRDGLVVAAAVAGHRTLGALVVLPPGPALTALQVRTVERAAQLLALMTLNRDAVDDARIRARADLVEDLLDDRMSGPAVAALARTHGGTGWMCAAICLDPDRRENLTRALASQAGWLVGRDSVGVIVIAPAGDAERFGQALSRQAARSRVGDVAMIVSDRAVPLDRVGGEARNARDIARLASALRLPPGVHRVAAYLPYLAVAGGQAGRVDDFIGNVLGPVIAWEKSHSGALVETLDAFLTHQASTSQAARALFVHPNTVTQRLARVDALLGSYWRGPEGAFRVGLAARLHRLRTP